MKHEEPSPLAGKTVMIKQSAHELGGEEYQVEDYWDRVAGGSWMNAEGNPAVMMYAIRSGCSPNINIPINDDVLYGKINSLGHLVHTIEIEEYPPKT